MVWTHEFKLILLLHSDALLRVAKISSMVSIDTLDFSLEDLNDQYSHVELAGLIYLLDAFLIFQCSDSCSYPHHDYWKLLDTDLTLKALEVIFTSFS